MNGLITGAHRTGCPGRQVRAGMMNMKDIDFERKVISI